MDALRRTGGGSGTGVSPADGIGNAYARILSACLYAGLSRPDAEDVAQDIWAWILRSGQPAELYGTPWLGAVARNFILRYWRRRQRRSTREAQAVVEAVRFARTEGTEAIDSRLSLDRMEQRLPSTEAKLLRLVRNGCTFAQAVRRLGIPRGSRCYYRKRLISHLKQGLTAAAGPLRLKTGGQQR